MRKRFAEFANQFAEFVNSIRAHLNSLNQGSLEDQLAEGNAQCYNLDLNLNLW